LYDEAVEILKPIFRNPQYALSLAKQAVHASQSHTFNEGLKAESEAFSRCFHQDYFVKLMIHQLKEGTLKTTAQLPYWVYQKGNSSQ
jgi:enoyl-CoA hydratase/carnithine racemase